MQRSFSRALPAWMPNGGRVRSSVYVAGERDGAEVRAGALVPRTRRPVYRLALRPAARAVLDPADRILHVRFQWPDKTTWAPGGGIDPAEAPEQAIMRELAEECHLHGFELGSCIWMRDHWFAEMAGWAVRLSGSSRAYGTLRAGAGVDRGAARRRRDRRAALVDARRVRGAWDGLRSQAPLRAPPRPALGRAAARAGRRRRVGRVLAVLSASPRRSRSSGTSS